MLYLMYVATTLSLALFSGQHVDTNLVKIPGQIASNRLPYMPSYYHAVNLAIPVARTLSVDWALDSSLLKHSGGQSNLEFTAGISPQYELSLPALGFACNFVFVEGLSYAYGDPVVEKGVDGQKANYVHLQNHLAFELALRISAWPNVSLPLRLHHRSGVYGLLAPRGVGSNFLSLGLRWYPDDNG